MGAAGSSDVGIKIQRERTGYTMARNGDSLSYIMKAQAIGAKTRHQNQMISDRDTIRGYKNNIDRFCNWAKESGLTKEQVLASPKEHLQSYTNHLVQSGYSKSTIHTYIAAPCKGLGIPMQHISKPERSADDITRSRGGKNKQGERESQQERFERLVKFQSVAGLRRSELADLKGEDLRMRDGKMYIVVEQGKGGKEQWQYILPKDTGIVQSTFDGIKKGEHVFSDAEMRNKIDLHGMRADHAKDCYDYYVDRMQQDPAYREQLREELQEYFQQHHKSPTEAQQQQAYERFCLDMCKNEGVYQMRGESKKLAEEHDRPTDYDRVALMAVSVLQLAHWRLDVTVINYLT